MLVHFKGRLFYADCEFFKCLKMHARGIGAYWIYLYPPQAVVRTSRYIDTVKNETWLACKDMAG